MKTTQLFAALTTIAATNADGYTVNAKTLQPITTGYEKMTTSKHIYTYEMDQREGHTILTAHYANVIAAPIL